MNNPFELLTDDKDKANVMRVSAYIAMMLAKKIKEVGRDDSARILGVSPSRVSRLANRSGSGMTIDLMLMSLSKLGSNVDAIVGFSGNDASSLNISINI